MEMDERHAAETAALEQRERDAAGPQEETTDILATDLYSFSLPAAETQKQVGHTCTVESVLFLHYCAVLCCAVLCCAVLCCAVLCCAVLCCAVLCCAVLCCAVLCVQLSSVTC